MENDLSSDFINGDSNTTSLLSLLLSNHDNIPTISQTQTSTMTIPSPIYNITPKPESPTYPYPYLNSQLPNLVSLENPPTPQPQPQPPFLSDSYSLESIVQNYIQNSHNKKRKRPNQPKTKTLCQKAFSLGKLLPGVNTHKRSTVDLLEEACKYIKFLQAQLMWHMGARILEFAQVSVLRSMPEKVSGGGGEGRLSRQQVLEVVVNSPVAQTVMAENGWCIVAAEQVALIKKIEARNRLIHHLLSNIPL